jgi:DNA-binding XRE family transcriptional regulator
MLMKNEQREQAKEMYFQSNYSKSEIAEKLGVNRKTILFWSRQDNWDRLKRSARTVPSLVAEKCYFLIDQFADKLLSDANPYSNFGLKDAQTIHLLASTIKKLKNRSTINESMEMFSFFLPGLNRRSPELAEQITPMIEEYIEIRRNAETNDFLPEDFNSDGTLPFPIKESDEKIKDEKDWPAIYRDFEMFLQSRENKPAISPELNSPGRNDSLSSGEGRGEVYGEAKAA